MRERAEDHEPRTVASLPLIKVNGSGDGTLMIGGGTMLFDGLSGAVNVDCDAKIVYTGDGSASSPMLLATPTRNRRMAFDSAGR